MSAKQGSRAMLGRNLPRIQASWRHEVACPAHLTKEDTCVCRRSGVRSSRSIACQRNLPRTVPVPPCSEDGKFVCHEREIQERQAVASSAPCAQAYHPWDDLHTVPCKDILFPLQYALRLLTNTFQNLVCKGQLEYTTLTSIWTLSI